MSYIGVVKAIDEYYLLGGRKVVFSSRFADKIKAQKWAKIVREQNELDNRYVAYIATLESKNKPEIY